MMPVLTSKYFGAILFCIYMAGIYLGVGFEALLFVLTVFSVVDIYVMYAAQRDGILPKKLRFIAAIRGTKVAFFWGYVIDGLILIFCVAFALAALSGVPITEVIEGGRVN